MLEDIYLEYIIKRKRSTKQTALLALLIFAALLLTGALLVLTFAVALALVQSGITSSYATVVGLLLIVLLWYGAYLLISMQSIEYEYILTNSEMDIDKVMSKKGRKSVVSFDFKDINICAPIDDNEHNADYRSVTPSKTYDAVGDKDRGTVYFVDIPRENGTERVLFQPTSKMINSAKRYNPRKIFVAEEQL